LSFGTLIALQVAIEFPSEFSTLTLAAPALGDGPQEPEIATRYQELVETYRLSGFGPQLRQRWMQSPPNIFKGAESKPELWATLWRLVGRHAWWELGDGSYARLSSYPQPPARLRAVQASTLVLIGEKEFMAFKRCAEIIRRSIPDCQRLYLPGVGHLCMLEDSARVTSILRDHWLTHSRLEPQATIHGGANERNN
jgi:2-succinyl-6-hydroxy-2,4-cyclohexadiene-1-carboxylate synthase